LGGWPFGNQHFHFRGFKKGRSSKRKRILAPGWIFNKGNCLVFVYWHREYFSAGSAANIVRAGRGRWIAGLQCDFCRTFGFWKQIKEYSQWMVFSNLLTAAGTVAGGFVASMFGFHWLFICMGTLALVSFFGILVQPRKLL